MNTPVHLHTGIVAADTAAIGAAFISFMGWLGPIVSPIAALMSVIYLTVQTIILIDNWWSNRRNRK